MIDQIAQRLQDWVAQALPETTVTIEPPRPSPGGQGVSLYLFELVDDPPLRGSQRAPLQAAARFLVTTWAGTTADALRLLGDLLFAALEKTEFQVELTPLPAAAWATFGLSPQPSFVLRVPLQWSRPQPPVKRVRHPLAVQPTPFASLRGRVVGPDDIPLPDAVVMIEGLDAVVRTDPGGNFYLGALPSSPASQHLRVRAKGQELMVDLRLPMTDDQPLLIRFASFD